MAPEAAVPAARVTPALLACAAPVAGLRHLDSRYTLCRSA